MLKRTLSLIFSLIILGSSFALCSSIDAKAADDTMSVLASLTQKFPEGKYWNHMGSDENSPDTVTDTPCASHSGCSRVEGACSCNSFDRAIQCMGYAHKIAYDITGASPRSSFTKSTKLSVSKLRVGDIIRFRYDRHSICVTGISGTKISFTDCNWDYHCGIRWDVMDISYITSRGFTYVLHLEGNNRKNTDLEFFNHPEKYLKEETPEEEKPEDKEDNDTVQTTAESWQMSDSNLNVRSTASLSGAKVGSIPANATFTVSEKKHSEDYLWGYVEYEDIKGWAALNYSTYLSGAYQVPDISNEKELYDSRKITFKWNEVDGADSYLFKLYDSDKKLIEQKNASSNKITVTVPENAVYYAEAYALSSHAPSWSVKGELISFTVGQKVPAISGITLSKSSLSLVKGKSSTLKATVEPSELSSDVVWSSSDSEVVSVKNGTVKALSFGKATVTCSDESGNIKAVCEVTVKPAKITNPTQNLKKTTVSSVTFSWDKVSGADSYDILRYNSSTKKYVKIANVEATEYTDTKLSGGKDYYYLIRAVADTDDGAINSSNTKVKISTKPKKVTGVKQSSSATGKITLSWNKSANADKYAIYKYNTSTKKYKKVKTVSDLKVTFKVNPGEATYYKVYAVTETSWGNLFSAVSDKAYTFAGPDIPTLSVKSSKKGTATLKWNSIDNAKYYYVYRYTSSGYKRIAVIKNGKTEFVDSSLKSGTKYYYRVRAVGVKGGVTGYGSYSAKVSVRVK